MSSNSETNSANGINIATDIDALTADLVNQSETFSEYVRASASAKLPGDPPAEVQAAKEKLLEDALQIFNLVSGPTEYIQNVLIGCHYMEILRWMSHFKIFELVPLDGRISYSELAAKAGVTEERLKSLARMAMTSSLFAEPEKGFMAHSATSAALVTNQGLASFRLWITAVTGPAASSMVTAHARWPDDTAPNRTAFSAAFDTDLGMYDYIATHPELYRMFDTAMQAVAKSPMSHLKHLVSGFDWGSLGKATVVDVGGNVGHSCVELAKSFHDLDFIVEDTPHIVEEGIKTVQANDPTLAERIKFREYDFFTKQPVQGAQVYLLRQILHNWNFDKAVEITKNTAASMGQDSHMLIMDMLLPEPGSVSSVHERVLRSRDVVMMQLFNSLERDLEGWQKILTVADPRLRINAVNKPEGSFLTVIDVVKV
ncbi:O-methyltransferase [Fusarium acuminatum]|uniref:O-methyltransferase n=1 Tax=Fusarium acuminatum TaxID=5515 RepID=A0ABZ2XBZ7_9HYPO